MRFFFVATFAMSLFVAGAPVLAQPVGPEPHWLKQPSAADMAAVFPLKAARLGHGGGAQLGCAVQPDGSLTRCDVLSENPADEGFADAALKLVKLYKLASPDGSPLPRTTIDVPVRFSLAP